MISASLSVKEFNDYLKRAKFDKTAFEVIYRYGVSTIKDHVINKYGLSNFYDNIPHDVVTKIIFEKPPDKPITNPTAYLCRAARNYMYSAYHLKDNQSLELFEDCAYIPEFENTLEFSDEVAEQAWYKLDKESRYILYLSEILDYPLREVAERLNKSYDGVKSKKWRAKVDLKNYIKTIKQTNKEKK